MTRRRPAPQAIRRPDRSPSWIRAAERVPGGESVRSMPACPRRWPPRTASARSGTTGVVPERDRGAGAGAAPGGRRRGGDRRRLLRRHRRRRPGPTGSRGSSCSKPATKAAGRAPGTAAWSSRSSSTDRTRWSAATATPVGPCCGRRSPRTRSCATSWRTRRSSATGGSAVGSSSPIIRARCRRCGRRQASGSRPGSRCALLAAADLGVGDRLGRVRRRAADGADGRGAAGEAPRRPRRAGARRGRRGAPPHAGDAPRAARSGVPRPDRARRHRRGRRARGRERRTSTACSRPSSSACCRWGASSSPPSRSRPSGRGR